MSDSPEDFERLLERCRAQLSAISLSLPILEAEGGPNALPPPAPGILPPAPAVAAAPGAGAHPVRAASESFSAPRAPEAAAPARREPPPALPAAEASASFEPEPELRTEPSVALEDAPTFRAPETRRFSVDDLPAAPPAAPISREPTGFEDDADAAEEPLRRTSFDLPDAPVRDEPAEPEAPPVERFESAPAARAPRPAPRTRPRAESPFGWGALGLVAVVAAISFGIWRLQRPAADRVFELEPAQAAALRPERRDLLVASGTALLDVSEQGRVLERRRLDAPISSLSWNAGALWSVDGRTRALVEARDGGGATTFTLNHVPRAVYAHGRYLWTLEEGGKTIRQFLVSRSLVGIQLQPLDLYQLSDLTADAIAVDDSDVLWIFDRDTRRVYRLRAVGAALRPIDSAPLTPAIGSGDVRAMGLDESSLWLLVASGGRSTVHRMTIDRLGWTTAP